MNRIHHGTHICIQLDNQKRPSVSADDYELFDMLADFLTEDCDFDYEYLYIKNWPMQGEHTIVIESGITYEELMESIKKLDLDEIERIYLLNN